MTILITYDVETISEEGQKRLRQVAKVCKDYGQRVQNSVFECEVTEAQFAILKSKLSSIIDNQSDSIRFYRIKNNSKLHTITLGKTTSFNVNDPLII